MCGDVETLSCLLTVNIDIENMVMVNITLINIYIDIPYDHGHGKY